MVQELLKKYRFLIIVALVFLILRLPSLFEPYWYGDEGIYLVLGQGVRKGLLLYRDIHDNKPPSLYYLAALAQTVFGFRLLLLVWMIPTIYSFKLLSEKLLSARLVKPAVLIFLILTSIPLFEGNIANAEVFMLLPTILGFLLLLNSTSLVSLITSGFLLGFAFTIKVPVFIEFGFLCAWLVLLSGKFQILKINLLKLIPQLFVFILCVALLRPQQISSKG